MVGHSEEVVVDEGGVDGHECVGVRVEHEDHGGVEHDAVDDLVEEGVEQGEELGVVVERGEEAEQGDEQEVVRAKVHLCVCVVYVADDADENRDEQQVVDLLGVMLIPVLDVVDEPSDRDLEVFYEVVYLAFHFHFQNLCLS